ncbi:hypothetical protein ACTHQF_06670 [Pedobacter sp. SAFR-022]|uniref:hypothetical protein n=1 Tax=Pedobacter sp. SAFR-022 TaxID=3436861 RepID=UPI003F80FEC3
MANSTSIAKSFKLLNPGNLDGWYGPYESISLANAGVPAVIRLHKKVGINTTSGLVEYWWNGGNGDGNLVPVAPDLKGGKFSLGSDPLAGSSVGTIVNRVYFYTNSLGKGATLKSIGGNFTQGGTLRIKRFTLSSDGLTFIYHSQTSAIVTAGLVSVKTTADLQYYPGDIIAIQSSDAIISKVDGPGWSLLQGKASQTDVVSNTAISTLSPPTELALQLRFNFEVAKEVLSPSDIVNSLTIGDNKKVLSAESGKELNSRLVSVEKALAETILFGHAKPSSQGALSSPDRAYWIDSKIPINSRPSELVIAVPAGGILSVKRFVQVENVLVYKGEFELPVAQGINTIPIENDFHFFSGDTIAIYNTGGLFINTSETTWSSIKGGAAYKDVTSDVPMSALSSSTASLQFQMKLSYVGDISQNANLLITPDPEGYWMVPCYGQSLSINTDAGPSTFTEIVPIAYTQTGAHANVQDMNGGYAEMFLAMSKEYKALPSDFRMMTCLGGAGGRSVLQLSKGSTFYTTLLNNIRAGKATADAAGKPYNVPAFIWTQGEEDYRTGGVPANYGLGDWNPNLYKSKLKTLLNDLNVDIKAITGQKNHVKMIMYQTGSHNAYYRYPRIAMQQLELALEDERVSLAKTMYEADYNTADYVHAPAKTYRNMGNHYGIALYNATVKNERVLPISPTQHFIVGTDVYIKFYTPFRPLVFDTTTVGPLPDGNFGFNLYSVVNETNGAFGTISQAAQSITSVSLFGPDVVKISLSAVPATGTRLTYGVNGDGSNSINGTIDGVVGKSGRMLGARGNLRDSRGYMNPVANYFTLYGWCPIFEIVL